MSTATHDDSKATTVCSTVLSILLPPLGVFWKCGCGIQLFINIVLTILGYFPGVIHAILIICID
jgi:uncharacterized membrane protein YqaE (UPF0057 family)